MAPMIYTTKGNMPIESLQYNVEWFENEFEIGLREIYRLEGEVVRQSVHVRKKQGSDVGSEQVEF